MVFAWIMFLAIFLLSLSPAFGGTIYENFDNNTYNQNLFIPITSGSPNQPTVTVVDTHLEVTIPGPINGIFAGGLEMLNFQLVGDFDVQVDFNLSAWPANNGVGAGIVSPLFDVRRVANNGQTQETYALGEETYALGVPGIGITNIPTSDMFGKLRLKRIGSTVQGFYWGNNAWQPIGSYTDATLAADTAVYIGVYGGGFTVQPPLTVAFDNFKITNKYLGNVLNFQKTDSPDPVAPGGNLTYTLCFDNVNNDYPVTMVFITDKLPSEVTFVSATAGGTYDSEAHMVVWDIGTVPPGTAKQCVKVVVQVKSDTPSGTKILNSATISSNETPPVTKSAETTVKVAQFKLDFPLSGYTPYTAPVIAVVDHGCFSTNPVKFYVRNGRVKAFNGEVGKKIYGVLIKNGIWRGYRNEAGTPFLQTVLPNYTGGEFLFFDGHAGYDFEVPVGTPVKASGRGRLFIAQTDPVNGGGWSWYQTFYINHGNGYFSWYLYAGLDPALLAKVLADGFVQVQKGDVIGTTWNPWLHFDVRRGGNEPKNVRDPYKDGLWEQPPG